MCLTLVDKLNIFFLTHCNMYYVFLLFSHFISLLLSFLFRHFILPYRKSVFCLSLCFPPIHHIFSVSPSSLYMTHLPGSGGTGLCRLSVSFHLSSHCFPLTFTPLSSWKIGSAALSSHRLTYYTAAPLLLLPPLCLSLWGGLLRIRSVLTSPFPVLAVWLPLLHCRLKTPAIMRSSVFSPYRLSSCLLHEWVCTGFCSEVYSIHLFPLYPLSH